MVNNNSDRVLVLRLQAFLNHIMIQSTLEAELQRALEPLRASLNDSKPTKEELRQDHLEGERIDDMSLEYADEIKEWEEQK